ncbi:MAG: HAMP domain-containing protein [Desulfuromonadaceae bacterium]|nr:HAMP domain-containing protein [Desulfuromonadaceae bacterium]
MRISITQRLFGAIMLAAVLAVFGLVSISQWNLKQGFLRFIKEAEQAGITRLTTALEGFYAEQGSWEPLQRHPERWQQLVFQSLPDEGARRLPEPAARAFAPPPPPRNAGVGPGPGPAPPFMPHRPERFFLLDAQRQPLIGGGAMEDSLKLTPLHCRDELIGYLGYQPIQQLTEDRHLHFLREQKLTFILVALIIVVVSALLSLLLARRLVQPLSQLARATHQLSGGDFSCRVPVAGSDELGRLATDFNLLALTLEKNEQARRQWVADISHELRTPIGVLRGEIEALQDGVRQPDAQALQSLHSETLHLTRLVDDLYQLTLSDLGALNYRKVRLELTPLLERLLRRYEDDFRRHGLKLVMNGAADLDTQLFGDPERLQQLFSNLLDNSLKYTDPGGTLQVTLQSGGKDQLLILFDDSGPGVGENELPRLFDRLYRVESSRNRQTGGAGLGLAICRNIAEAHQGTISAHPSALGGLSIRLLFPQPER